jgi:hypothetical protein
VLHHVSTLSQILRRDFLRTSLGLPIVAGMPFFQSSIAKNSACFAASPGLKPAGSFGRAKRCLFVFLNGGPSQLDTWDMKLDAPADVRGELQPLATKTPGVLASELLPRMATLTDRFKIVRSVTHTASVHTTGVYTMLTGTEHRTPKVDQTVIQPDDHPHLGSIVSSQFGWRNGTPSFLCLPSLFRAPPVDGIWPGQTAGFLGRKFDPFVVDGEKQTARFHSAEVELPSELTAGRLLARQELSRRLNRGEAKEPRCVQTWSEINEQAWSLVDSTRFRKATSLENESAETHDRYGRHLFGQGMLLARRLLEADVPFVTVYWNDPTPAGAGGGEFDSHGFIYKHMRNRLMPPTDRALAAVFEDLWDRGLEKDTLIVGLSEFGRTPRINKDAGRDHWPEAQSILMAGAGITGGTVHGATDRYAAFPTADPVTPADLGQTILHLLGVDPNLELRDAQGRPIRASQGKADEKLMS